MKIELKSYRKEEHINIVQDMGSCGCLHRVLEVKITNLDMKYYFEGNFPNAVKKDGFAHLTECEMDVLTDALIATGRAKLLPNGMKLCDSCSITNATRGINFAQGERVHILTDGKERPDLGIFLAVKPVMLEDVSAIPSDTDEALARLNEQVAKGNMVQLDPKYWLTEGDVVMTNRTMCEEGEYVPLVTLKSFDIRSLYNYWAFLHAIKPAQESEAKEGSPNYYNWLINEGYVKRQEVKLSVSLGAIDEHSEVHLD